MARWQGRLCDAGMEADAVGNVGWLHCSLGNLFLGVKFRNLVEIGKKMKKLLTRWLKDALLK